MRSFVAVVPAIMLVALAGCLEDEKVETPAATPEDACEARGLADLSCSQFCSMQAAVCGLPLPTPVPYPTLPTVPVPLPTPAGIIPGELPPLPEAPKLPLPEGAGPPVGG